MPRYDYACHECDHRFEAVHAITSEALSVCPECGGTLRRVIGAVGVSFKGSGFYRTDSREAARKGRAKATSPSSPSPATPSSATSSSATPSSAAPSSAASSSAPAPGSASNPSGTAAPKPAVTSAAKTSSAASGKDS